jgi:hypothetical protein
MDFRSIPQCVQAVQWDGSRFSEEPDWLPKRVSHFTFAMCVQQGLFIQQPYAWLGNGKHSVRISPGDELVLENGHVRVIPGDMFRELFQPVEPTRGFSLQASA